MTFINYESADGTSRIIHDIRLEELEYFQGEFNLKYVDTITGYVWHVMLNHPKSYIYYNHRKYSTEKDYYKLQQILKQEHIKGLLERM